MSDDETANIILLPVHPARPLVVAPGSVRIMADCGHESWISPDGMQFHLSPSRPTRLVCDRCIPAGELEVAEMPGSRETLRSLFGDQADEIIATVTELGRRGRFPKS